MLCIIQRPPCVFPQRETICWQMALTKNLPTLRATAWVQKHRTRQPFTVMKPTAGAEIIRPNRCRRIRPWTPHRVDVFAVWANMSLTSICTTTATPNHNRVHVQNCEAQTQKIRYSWSTLQKKPLSWAEQAERICCVPEVLRQIYWISGLSGNQTSEWKKLLQMKQSGCVLLDAYLLFC